MIAVIQRVTSCSVSIDGAIKSEIGQGLLVLLGVSTEDTEADADWLLPKILQMRIFNDAEDKMNLSVQDVKGQMMVVSQFTLLASTKKGNRPSFIEAARPEQAIPLYEYFVSKATNELSFGVFTGVFGADMKIKLLNDGPVTIIIDSKSRK